MFGVSRAVTVTSACIVQQLSLLVTLTPQYCSVRLAYRDFASHANQLWDVHNEKRPVPITVTTDVVTVRVSRTQFLLRSSDYCKCPVHKTCTGVIENTDLLCFFSMHISVRYNKQNMQSPFMLLMPMFNAMHKCSLCPRPRAMSVRLSVRPSVTFVYSIETNKHVSSRGMSISAHLTT